MVVTAAATISASLFSSISSPLVARDRTRMTSERACRRDPHENHVQKWKIDDYRAVPYRTVQKDEKWSRVLGNGRSCFCLFAYSLACLLALANVAVGSDFLSDGGDFRCTFPLNTINY